MEKQKLSFKIWLIWRKVENFFWRIGRIFHKCKVILYKYFKYKNSAIEPTIWNKEAHQHICLAVNLLEPKDFEEVCPKRGKCEVERDCYCDYCRYMKILEFNINEETGRKEIELL